MIRIFSLFLASLLSISVLAENKQTSNNVHSISVGRRYVMGINEVNSNERIDFWSNLVEYNIEDCIPIVIYDSEGFVIYRDVKSMSSVADFLLPNLDPAEDYTMVTTIDGETYVMEMIP